MPHRIKGGLYRFADTRRFLPLLLFVWGVWMFVVNPALYSPSFIKFKILPHEIWGVGIAAAGLVAYFLTVFSEKANTPNGRNIAFTAGLILTSAGYVFILTMLLLGNWTSTGTVTYFFLVCLSLLNLLEYLGIIYE
jgi:hypothetical protein